MYKAFRNRRIKVNGKRQSPDYRICEGDIVELYINDEYFMPNGVRKLSPAVRLDMLYEDENLIFINKPAGLLCHSDNKNQSNVIDSVLAYLQSKNEFSLEKENYFTPALCNRIDQGTEGIVIAAKNYPSLRDMNRIIRNDLATKTYLFVSEERIEPGIYEAFRYRDKEQKKTVVSPVPKDGYSLIKTWFRLKDETAGVYLYECDLMTGKTHQIRAHAAFLGAPILGDTKYGGSAKGLRSQLLCSWQVSFHDIPPENKLSYLEGRTIRCNDNSVIRYFENRKSR